MGSATGAGRDDRLGLRRDLVGRRQSAGSHELDELIDVDVRGSLLEARDERLGGALGGEGGARSGGRGSRPRDAGIAASGAGIAASGAGIAASGAGIASLGARDRDLGSRRGVLRGRRQRRRHGLLRCRGGGRGRGRGRQGRKLDRGRIRGDGRGRRVEQVVVGEVVPPADGLVLVVDVDALRSRLGVDLDALLGEEAADAAHQALALAQDDRVGAELGADLGDQILELAAAVGAHAAKVTVVAIRVGLGEGAHALTTPMVSTLMPGATSL